MSKSEVKTVFGNPLFRQNGNKKEEGQTSGSKIEVGQKNDSKKEGTSSIKEAAGNVQNNQAQKVQSNGVSKGATQQGQLKIVKNEVLDQKTQQQQQPKFPNGGGVKVEILKRDDKEQSSMKIDVVKEDIQTENPFAALEEIDEDMEEQRWYSEREEVNYYLERGTNPHKEVFKNWTKDQVDYYRSIQFGEDVYQKEDAPDFMFFDKDDWRRGEERVVKTKANSNG